ncbi:MAG TPA: prolyl oligopeptidase family serine peptidase [Candidatus Baltobacteraceae bacterium]|jgi:dipeptidyl aminopeptidase/acylaminoacyl peptidase|nr:prolyl oligopeptidase family serine peptidase [Candidatus Baltobacteraceae bacterium]
MHLLLGALFSLAQVLGYPFPDVLVSGPDGHSIAYVLNEKGVRSIWFARAPLYAPHMLWNSASDDGQEITGLSISKDGKFLVYARGGAHDSNWIAHPWPDPDDSPSEPMLQVFSLPTAGGAPKVLGEGDAPVISPDNSTVAFVHDPDLAVWSAPIDGSKTASRMFFDRGQDSDLTWSPRGDAIAFTSDRGDHSFIGIYRNQRTPIAYLAPSTSRDFSPQWSPDGTRIAYVRIPGSGGPPQDSLQRYPLPWAIWVADAANASGYQVWHSANGLRDSLPRIHGPQLNWIAGDRLVFISEQTNWPHLYAVSARGGTARLLTPGAFMVEDTAISPDLQTIYYTADTGKLPGDDDRRHIFRVTSAGGPQEVTEGQTSEWWPAATADGVAYVQAGARAPMTIVIGNRTLDADQIPGDFPTQALTVPKEVTFRAKDGLLIHGQLFESASAGGVRNKPAVVFVHGGPPRQMLLTWHYFDYYSYGYAENQYLASRGFVVLSINYRLGIGYGHDFNDPPHAGPAGAAEYQDVLAGARFLQGRPSVDRRRIGIWGGSYGGYLTAMALAKNSNIFKAGVDWHGVHDWSMFPEWFGDTSTQRYQDFDRKRFLKTAWLSSPDAYIATWKSPVLLIQGDDDRNVRFHQMVDLVQRLRLAGVPYEEYVIPNDIHGFLRWQSWYDADSRTSTFLIDHLHP